jgi:hypothetical protein
LKAASACAAGPDGKPGTCAAVPGAAAGATTKKAGGEETSEEGL